MNPLLSNFHTHTCLCDGRDTPEEMVREAIGLGMWGIGFSGHMDPDIHMDFPAYLTEIRRLREKYRDRIEIFAGVELDTLYDRSLAEGAEYVIGSTHFLDVDSPVPMSVDNTKEMLLELCRDYFSGDWYRLAAAYYETEAQVFEKTGCTFVGHFDLVTRFNDELGVIDEEDPRYLSPALACMEHLVKQGLPFEINCGAFNRGRKRELYPNMTLLRSLREMGGEILISSDAHDREHIIGGFQEARDRAKACGFSHALVLKRRADDSVALHPVSLD